MAIRSNSRFVLVAALCSAGVGTVLAAVYITVLYIRKGSPSNAADIVIAFLVGVLFAAIPAGLFGLIAGAVGGSWLVLCRARFKSSSDVARAGTLAGAVLGLLYPVVSLAMHWTSTESARAVLSICAVSLGIGAVCGWLFGRLFGAMILLDSMSTRKSNRH